MNEEEKKAIDELWRFDCCYNEQIKTILNLIEKLKKENEELGISNKYTIHLTDKQYNVVIENAQNDINQKWIQKVKNNIEELKAQYKTTLEENSTEAFILKCQITILQELLEGRKENESN